MNTAADRAPEESLADLRHRLRTPLNHIIGYSELLLADLSEDQTDIAETLRSVAEYSHSIVSQIQQSLSPAAPGSGKEKKEKLRAEIGEPLRVIIARVGTLAGRLRGGALLDVLRINLACMNLMAFVQGEDKPGRHAEQSFGLLAARPAAYAQPARVLVVDDNEANRDVLNRQLERFGHTPVCFESGENALDALQQQAFDLVLLDVMMPGMSGVEVLQRIKSNHLLADLPVIMISALDELEGAARCIELGADDYLLKPFNHVLLRARLNSSLERKRLHEEDKQRASDLERASQDLKRANEDLNSFAFAASHDLQEPLRTITTTLQLLQLQLGTALTTDQLELIQLAVTGAMRMKNLISDLLSYALANTQDRILEDVSLESALDDALVNLRQSIEESGATIIRESLPSVLGDRAQLTQLFQNLIGNGIKYHGEEPPEIHVKAEKQAGKWLVSIRDNGIGIEERYQHTIFQPFRRLHGSNRPGTGLGLAICERIVKACGGSIWVASMVNQGSTFYFTLDSPE